MEWVEVQGKSVDVAVAAALAELGLESADEATIEVIQEPKSGFLGIGGQEAIVKVTRKPRSKRRRRRRGRGKDRAGADSAPKAEGKDGGKGGGSRGNGGKSGRGGKRPDGSATGASSEQRRSPRQTPKQRQERTKEPAMNDTEKPKADINEQAEIAVAFLKGLLDAFGLEGDVTSRIEEDVLYLDVAGDQTEALVGPKGSVMHAVLELTRTVIQRKTFGAPRMRIDIAGYAERRREALKIYTTKLAEKAIAEGGEIMLEPMNAADRKVVHDTVAEIEGVRSFSEGEEPQRAVVIAAEHPAPAAAEEPAPVEDEDVGDEGDEASDEG